MSEIAGRRIALSMHQARSASARAILDDLAARVFADLTRRAQRVEFAQRRLSTFVRAAEGKCERGEVSASDTIVLEHGDFPAGTF